MRPRVVSPPPARVALFSDVDGTLLDTRDRLALGADTVATWHPQIELILASSRTLAELVRLQRRLGLTGPLVAENGAIVSFPAGWRGTMSSRREVIALGAPAATLVPRIHAAARRAGVRVMNQKQLLPDRGRSLRRSHSVCLRDWPGEDAGRFLAILQREGLEASRSGTWITITSGPHKGTGARAVLDRARRLGARFRHTVAIGNAANDGPLLSAVRHRFAVRNPRRGHDPALLALAGVHPLSSSGARAWREALPLILALAGGH